MSATTTFLRRAASLSASILTIGLATAPAAARVKVDVVLGGGTVVDFGESGETGNAFGATALLGLGDFAVGAGVATVLPDSRTQGQFTAWWLEGRWYALGRDFIIEPYLVVGFGVAGGDDFVPGSLDFAPARWSSETGPLGMLGVGARYGDERGAFLGVDVRAWNLGHLGFAVTAGYTF